MTGNTRTARRFKFKLAAQATIGGVLLAAAVRTVDAGSTTAIWKLADMLRQRGGRDGARRRQFGQQDGRQARRPGLVAPTPACHGDTESAYEP